MDFGDKLVHADSQNRSGQHSVAAMGGGARCLARRKHATTPRLRVAATTHQADLLPAPQRPGPGSHRDGIPGGLDVAMRIQRLSDDDRLLLRTDKAWPQDVGVIAILEGGPLLDAQGRVRIEVAREAVTRGLAGLPRRSGWRSPPRPRR